ncbi:MAG: hypothetical protein JEY79_17260 [Pseudodesulfovibrio sp.]|nr:hypothetical protein [Pseudodesulfovibrio sp.]
MKPVSNIDLTCLAADDIVPMLGMSKKTFYRVWKDLPHYFVTPKGWKNPRLTSARFDYSEVIEHCKGKSREEGYADNQHQLSKMARPGRKLESRISVQKATQNQSGTDSKGRPRMGSGRGKTDQHGTDQTRRFNVLDGV